VLYVYDSAFETELLDRIECDEIDDIKESSFDKIEITMQEITIIFKGSSGRYLYN